MSSLIVASNLDLMMLEIAIEQLAVPRATEFEKALLKKTVAMFRLLDKDWTSIYPHRTDYQKYRGSNLEIEPFNGGVSVVFPIPESSLYAEMEQIDLQLHVRRELSKYFELQQQQQFAVSDIVGIACIDVSDIFNGVIDALNKRRSKIPHDDESARVPVARSSKNTYDLLKEDGTESGAKVTVYLRLTHLGHSLISEIEVPDDPKLRFYAREETSHSLPYQLREITADELTGGCWGSGTLMPPRNPKDSICCCCDLKDGGKSLNGISKSSGNGNESLIADEKTDESGEKGAEKSSVSDKRSAENRNRKKNGNGNRNGNKNGNGNGNGNKNGNGNGNGNKNGNGNGNGNENEDGNENGSIQGKGDGNGNGGEEETALEVAEGTGTVSCDLKPALCGREGTCNKKDKKGKFGKCGKPDGEGGNPLACGERRKCARRKLASGSATVGIVDKKSPCPPPRPCPQNSCRCPLPVQRRSCPSPNWPGPLPCPTTSGTPSCPRCESGGYYGSSTAGSNEFCFQNFWDRPGYSTYRANPGQCRPMNFG